MDEWMDGYKGGTSLRNQAVIKHPLKGDGNIRFIRESGPVVRFGASDECPRSMQGQFYYPG